MSCSRGCREQSGRAKTGPDCPHVCSLVSGLIVRILGTHFFAIENAIMIRLNGLRRGLWLRRGVGLCCGLVWLCLPTRAHAICGLDAAAIEQIRDVEDPDARQAWARLIARQGGASCVVCHLAGYGPRNQYGTAINMLVTGSDRENASRKREAGRRVNDIPADPSLPDSPTFGDLIRRGLQPAADLAANLPAFQNIRANPPEDVTVTQAREMVRQLEAESRFGILQLSRTHDMSPGVAAVLAEFRGEMLILGLRSLSPEVARALEKSQAATVWLHSVTAVAPEAAQAIAGMRGNLVLSGLVKLDSVPLANKLAQRPAALSLPSLKEIGPEIAAALAANPRGLTLAALTDVSLEVQEALAKTAGALTVPNLKSLDSLPLTRKLAAGFASAVLLPGIKTLSVEQAEVIAAVNRPFFLGGTLLPLSVMSEEVAAVFAKNPAAGRLALGAVAISDPAFKILMESAVPINLRELTSLSDEQVRIIASAADRVQGGPFGSQQKIRVPMLATLDSAMLAETLLRSVPEWAGFEGVTRISPEAAAALGRIPEAGGKPNAGLNLPSLEELSPETARLLMNRSWATISLPSLRNASPETVRSLVRQTSTLTLGVTTLTPEMAAVFGEMASNKGDLGGGQLAFPCLSELSPEAARILVESLNRGEEVPVWGGLNRSPQMFIGGRGLYGVCPPLTPELAGELAKYRGRLSIAGLRTLSPESAAALVPYRGPSIELDGPATYKLSPETAAALATIPGNLVMPLRVLDSVPLAKKFAGQSKRTLDGLEFISAEAIAACVKYKGFFTLRQLTVLDSPELAARLIEDSSGQVLPSLRSITPAAAKVLTNSPNDIFLGLRSLDDPAVALTLRDAQKEVKLPELRAATPTVISILAQTRSIITPPLQSLFILPDGSRVGGDDIVLP